MTPLTGAEKTARYRARHPERIRALAEKNYDRKLEDSRRWKKRNSEHVLTYVRMYRAADEVRYRAHTQVTNALHEGRIQKTPCAVCGSDKVDAHHDDYTQPLDVQWLCRKHHSDLHRQEVAA